MAPFSGIIKRRYVDFIVHEVDEQNQVARLTDTSSAVPDDVVEAAKRMTDAERTAAFLAVAAKLLAPAEADRVAAFVGGVAAPPSAGARSAADSGGGAGSGAGGEAPQRAPLTLVFEAPATKEGRGDVYEAARLYLPEYKCDTAPAPAPSVGGGAAPAAVVAASDAGVSEPGAPAAQSSTPVTASGLEAGGGVGGASARPPSPSRTRPPVAAGAATYISLTRKPARAGGRQQQQGGSERDAWPRSRPDFLRFALHKRNYDTGAAIAALCRETGLRESSFGYAGVKDRRAVTTQWVTAYRVTPQRLARINSSVRGAAVGNFSYVPAVLRLGQLAGNRFTLVIKDVRLAREGGQALAADVAAAAGAGGTGVSSGSAAMDGVEAAGGAAFDSAGAAALPTAEAAALADASTSAAAAAAPLAPAACSAADMRASDSGSSSSGGGSEESELSAAAAALSASLACWRDMHGARFINYFGLQRFGQADAPTHSVGRALLRGDLAAAVRLILQPRAGERGASAAAREYFAATGDAGGALARMPHWMHVECAVLAEVAERGGVDAPGAAACAVRAVPPRMRNIYLHAYQSYLWNCAASLRLERYGDAVVAGDLVLAATDGTAAGGADAGCDDDDAEPAAAGARGAGAGASSSAAAGAASDALPAVRVVTAGDVAAGRYSLTDVLLPMVGYAVAYPQLDGLDAPAVHAMLVRDGIVAAAAVAPAASAAAATAHEPAAAGAGASAAACAAASDMSVASAEGALRSLFNHRDSVYRVSGAYRKLVTAAQGVEWAFLRYSDPEAQLALTDSDELPAGTAPRTIPPIPARDREALTQAQLGSDSSSGDGGPSAAAALTGEGRHLALRISFTLPKSAYATMLMREIMRDEAAAAAAE